eukprot:m.146742 g.146742  ORF g.146742 m.146742 type:complete len:697 (-) comp14975_c0_seq18:1173-3263(-)
MSVSQEWEVLYDYEVQDPGELPLKQGQVLDVLSTEGEWWLARNENGDEGLVPYNYVAPLPEGYKEQEDKGQEEKDNIDKPNTLKTFNTTTMKKRVGRIRTSTRKKKIAIGLRNHLQGMIKEEDENTVESESEDEGDEEWTEDEEESEEEVEEDVDVKVEGINPSIEIIMPNAQHREKQTSEDDAEKDPEYRRSYGVYTDIGEIREALSELRLQEERQERNTESEVESPVPSIPPNESPTTSATDNHPSIPRKRQMKRKSLPKPPEKSGANLSKSPVVQKQSKFLKRKSVQMIWPTRSDDDDLPILWSSDTCAEWLERAGFGEFAPKFLWHRFKGEHLALFDSKSIRFLGPATEETRSKLLQSIQTLLNLPAEEEESERIPINPTNLGKDNSFEKETQQNTSKPINRSGPSSKSNPPPMPPKPVKPSKINPKASKEPNKIEQLKNQFDVKNTNGGKPPAIPPKPKPKTATKPSKEATVWNQPDVAEDIYDTKTTNTFKRLKDNVENRCSIQSESLTKSKDIGTKQPSADHKRLNSKISAVSKRSSQSNVPLSSMDNKPPTSSRVREKELPLGWKRIKQTGGSYQLVPPWRSPEDSPIMFKELPFYHGQLERSEAESRLAPHPDGTYILRNSTHRNEPVVSVKNSKTAAKVSHCRIMRLAAKKYQLGGYEKYGPFTSIEEVFGHFPKFLKVPLLTPEG